MAKPRSKYDIDEVSNRKISGSLLGYAYLVRNTMQYEPVPVNTAYFFKDYAAKNSGLATASTLKRGRLRAYVNKAGLGSGKFLETSLMPDVGSSCFG